MAAVFVGCNQSGDAMQPSIECEHVRIGPRGLQGELALVPHALGGVVFAHGSGSSRLSPRNRLVADLLHAHRLDTLLFDLLTEDEAGDRLKVFDVGLLASRLGGALDWLLERAEFRRLRVGLFGASTGAAAVLRLAAEHPGQVGAVVSRGGRPDLAGGYLVGVQAPTLLIVGGLDTDVIELNRRAMRLLRCNKRLEIVPGAGHLFEQPGTLDAVAQLAGGWFAAHLSTGRSR